MKLLQRQHRLKNRNPSIQIDLIVILIDSFLFGYFRDETYHTRTKPNISPYLQKLPHSNFIQTILPPTSSSSNVQRRRRRRRSTSAARTRDDLLDSAYQPSNVDHLDLSSFFANSNHSFYRPTSAPTRRSLSDIDHFVILTIRSLILVCHHQQRKNVLVRQYINRVQKVKHFLSQSTVMVIMRKVAIVKRIH